MGARKMLATAVLGLPLAAIGQHQPVWVAGIQMGAPLRSAPCGDAWPERSYCVVEGKAVGASKGKYTGDATLRVSEQAAPDWLQHQRVTAKVVEGEVRRLLFFTKVSGQEEAFRELVAKYGKPVHAVRVPMRNGLGAQFDGIEASWSVGPFVLELQGALEGTTHGYLVVR